MPSCSSKVRTFIVKITCWIAHLSTDFIEVPPYLAREKDRGEAARNATLDAELQARRARQRLLHNDLQRRVFDRRSSYHTSSSSYLPAYNYYPPAYSTSFAPASRGPFVYSSR